MTNDVTAGYIISDVERLTQQEFAQRLGVTQGYVSRIEGRNFKVSGKLMAKVQNTLAADRN
ncbi:MAG: hypothetical protein A3B82_00540 [Methylophilales bacterium RIFCSPHIGHO2_02_FULL_57_10]|nr:MAG: hypothetical protein A3B82_00540 [Methylophilales bacterium RIFCSPHIGHO2_02_FULL_57_10]